MIALYFVFRRRKYRVWKTESRTKKGVTCHCDFDANGKLLGVEVLLPVASKSKRK